MCVNLLTIIIQAAIFALSLLSALTLADYLVHFGIEQKDRQRAVYILIFACCALLLSIIKFGVYVRWSTIYADDHTIPDIEIPKTSVKSSSVGNSTPGASNNGKNDNKVDATVADISGLIANRETKEVKRRRVALDAPPTAHNITALKGIFLCLVDSTFDIIAALAILNGLAYDENPNLSVFVIVGTFVGAIEEFIELILEITFCLCQWCCIGCVARTLLVLEISFALVEITFGIYLANTIDNETFRAVAIIWQIIVMVLLFGFCVLGCCCAKCLIRCCGAKCVKGDEWYVEEIELPIAIHRIRTKEEKQQSQQQINNAAA